MKIAIVGHFSFNKQNIDGQTIKTVALKDAFEKYTSNELVCVDTLNWKRHPIKLLFSIRRAFKNSESIIMLPAHNGVKVFSRLFVYFKKRYKAKIFYDVIGGWLPPLIQNKLAIKKRLKKFDGIFVETNTMEKALIDQGLTNVKVIPNFKDLEPLKEKDLNLDHSYPLKFCTFSRVTEAKGISDAITAIAYVNRDGIKAMLDIFGPIDEEYKTTFNVLLCEHSDYINYKGIISPSQSVDTLKDYFILLFPTKYFTEGIPGTIVDSFAAGVPVLCSKWQSCLNIIDENITGITYELGNLLDFKEKLIFVINNIELINSMKLSCIKNAKNYSSEINIRRIEKMLQE